MTSSQEAERVAILVVQEVLVGRIVVQVGEVVVEEPRRSCGIESLQEMTQNEERVAGAALRSCPGLSYS